MWGIVMKNTQAESQNTANKFLAHGVDLSYWNVVITDNDVLIHSRVDFKKMKADGCQFAILRIGYEARATRKATMDTAFVEYYKRAREAGMPLGLYFYALATTREGAIADAKWVIDVVEKNNMYFEYPLYYDIETEEHIALPSSPMEELCLGWCETIKAAGYFPGIYGGGTQVIDKLSDSFKSKYELWYPWYKSNYEDNQFNYDSHDESDYCGMWQYACFGHYDGVASTSLDRNICYKDYPAITRKYGYNNYSTYVTGANPVSKSYKSGKYYQHYSSITLTGDGRTDVVAIALSQLGYKESDTADNLTGVVSGKGNNYTEFNYNMGDWGIGYGGDGWVSCAAFVSWVLLQSGCTNQNSIKDWTRYHMGDANYIWRGVSCPFWANQLRQTGYFKDSQHRGGSYKPQSGDLIFYSDDGNGESHIGIVVYSDDANVYTVEGNTSEKSGLESSGCGVFFKSYALTSSYITGYGVLPYKVNENISKIDYSCSNPMLGIYIAEKEKKVFKTETFEEEIAVMPRFTMFEVNHVSSDGCLAVTYTNDNGENITGYIVNDENRVVQITRK